MSEWNKLSMKDRASYIRNAVSRGIYDVDKIREDYHQYATGGNLYKGGGWFDQHKAKWNEFLITQGVSIKDADRLSGFFAAQDGVESAGGTSKAAIEHNNYGGMQRNGKNIHYDSIEDYMSDKWGMMNRRFAPALKANTLEEYGTILGNPANAGKSYLYYVADGYNSKDPQNKEWVARQNAHMNNYIAGMQRYYGTPTSNRRKVIYLPSIQQHVEEPDALRVIRPVSIDEIIQDAQNNLNQQQDLLNPNSNTSNDDTTLVIQQTPTIDVQDDITEDDLTTANSILDSVLFNQPKYPTLYNQTNIQDNIAPALVLSSNPDEYLTNLYDKYYKYENGGNLYPIGGLLPLIPAALKRGKIPYKSEGSRYLQYNDKEDVYYGGELAGPVITGQKKRRSLVDYALWQANKHGVPAHMTNAVRDFNNRLHNFPIIAADAAQRYIRGKSNSILEAYKEADTNPSEIAKKLLIYPYMNTEANYSEEELAAMQDLVEKSGKGPGIITHEGYRKQNQGRYAGDIGSKDFYNPSKVVEWSVGQTGRTHDSDNTYLFDDFAYDTKDTKGVYYRKLLEGNANPVIGLRAFLGTIGSKGYNDGSNSATSIRTMIPIEALENAYSKHKSKQDKEKSNGGPIFNMFKNGGDIPPELNWPALGSIQFNAYPDNTFVADSINNKGHISTITPNQVTALWGGDPNDYESNRNIYPNAEGKYVKEVDNERHLINPRFGENSIIYNPKYINRDAISLDALHIMHDNPVYEDLYNDYINSANNNAIYDAAYDEFGDRGIEILDKYYAGQELSKEEQEIVKPIFDGFLRRQLAPNYMQNVEGGYDTPVDLSNTALGNKVNNIKDYLESYQLPEVIVTPNKHSLGGNIFGIGGPIDDWMRNWYQNRIPELTQNMDYYFGLQPAIDEEDAQNRMTAVNERVQQALDKTSTVPIFHGPLDPDIKGFYDSEDDSILLNYGTTDDVLLHEKTHALSDYLGNKWSENGIMYRNSPVWEAIGRPTDNDLYEAPGWKMDPDEYLDEPNEIYSRLMQIRFLNNLDPNHQYTIDEIEQLRREGKLTLPSSDGIERYTNEYIQHLLNDVALNNAPNNTLQDTPNITALGGPIVEAANIYDANIPSDIRQMMGRFTKDSTLNFWKNFVGGVATPVGVGLGVYSTVNN